jgi:hypothetical protein
MGKKPLADAVAAYAQAFRILHGAVRTASANARLYISFDHHWGVGMHGISPEEAVPGKDYLDAFAKLTSDLDWHVAWHPYPEDLSNPRAWADKTVTGDENTNKVTFKNLEVLCRYLRKPELLFKGEPRRVILSEQGFHLLLEPDGETLQAAAYAYAAEYQTAFYGLLASERAGIALSPALLDPPSFPDWRQAAFAQSSVLEAALLLQAAGDRALAKRFFLHLSEGLTPTERGQLADLVLSLDEPHIAVLIAKQAAEDGVILPQAYFPVTDLVPDGLSVSRALAARSPAVASSSLRDLASSCREYSST